jgi:hypothetical protein
MAVSADMSGATIADLVAAARRVLANGDAAQVPRYTLRQKALAWLQSGPRTAPQIATLLGISSNHAACMLWQMGRQGKVRRHRRWWRLA